MHCDIQINTQYTALALNMLWPCQTSSSRNDGLDQYPILCLPHNINIRDGLEFEGVDPESRTREIPGPEKYRGPALELFRGFSKLQFNFQCHDIVEVIQYFQVWRIVYFLFIWTLHVSANFREQFCALLQCSFDHDSNLNWTRLVRHCNNYSHDCWLFSLFSGE